MNAKEIRELLHKHIDSLTDEQLEQIGGGEGIKMDPDTIAKYTKKLKDLYEESKQDKQSQ